MFANIFFLLMSWTDITTTLLWAAFYESKCINLAYCPAIIISVRKAKWRAFVSAERPAYIGAFYSAQQSANVTSFDCANRLTILCSIVSTNVAALWRAQWTAHRHTKFFAHSPSFNWE